MPQAKKSRWITFWSNVRKAWRRDVSPSLPSRNTIVGVVFRDITPFILGAVLSKLVEISLPVFECVKEGMVPKSENSATMYYVAVLIAVTIAVSLAIVGLVVRFSIMAEEWRSTSKYNVFLNRDYYVGGKPRRNAFAACIAAAMRAEKSIVVMGPHFEDQQRGTAADDEQPSHDIYLEEGMTAAIERHLHNEGSDFRHVRVVQLDPQVYKSVAEERSCDASVFNNRHMAAHVKKMIEYGRESHSAEISMGARPLVPSFPSTLVVDDRYVFFSLPTSLGTEDQRGTVKGVELKYDVVLGIEDLSGEIPMLFRQLILQFKNAGCEIQAVTGI